MPLVSAWFSPLFVCLLIIDLGCRVLFRARKLPCLVGWLIVLVFFGPSTHFRSFQARSVNLTTLFLGKLPRQFPILSPVTWFEPRHNKTNKMAVRPAKTQIRLGMRPVWSESSLSVCRKLGSLATHWAHNEDSDQSLIWVFAGRTSILLVLSCRGSFGSETEKIIHYGYDFPVFRIFSGF